MDHFSSICVLLFDLDINLGTRLLDYLVFMERVHIEVSYNKINTRGAAHNLLIGYQKVNNYQFNLE